jgi:diguanylate cyclase (GGDEF)-like protein
MSSGNKLSCEDLRKRVRQLERLNTELLAEQQRETTLDFAWSGNLGHWYFNIETNTVVFHPLKVTTLGFDVSEIPESVPYQYFTEKLHPEDYEKAMQAMRDHLSGKSPVYEVSYRIQAKDGSYKWFYDRGKVTQWTEDGKPVFLAGIVFDITEAKEKEHSLEQQNTELKYEAGVDALTGLPNRRTIFSELEKRIELARVQQQHLSICMMDIDHFKQLNDTRGHVYGDYVLREVAKVLKSETRGMDLIGRYGGEEFLGIFYGADTEQSVLINDRIRSRIEQLKLEDGGAVTISGGVCQYSGQDLSRLIEDADANLYRAKDQGRNRIVG